MALVWSTHVLAEQSPQLCTSATTISKKTLQHCNLYAHSTFWGKKSDCYFNMQRQSNTNDMEIFIGLPVAWAQECIF